MRVRPAEAILAAVAFAAVGIAVGVLLVDRKASNESMAVQSTAGARSPAEAVQAMTLNRSMAQLIDDFNSRIASIDRRMLLPPASAFEELVDSQHHRALRHLLPDGIAVIFEVDKAAAEAFSMNASMPAGPEAADNVRWLLAVAAVGDTVLGQSAGGASEMVRLCSGAVRERQLQVAQITGKQLYCEIISGVWMAGITTRPKRPTRENL